MFDNIPSSKRTRSYFVCFPKYNNFPKWVIDQVLHQEKDDHRVIRRLQPDINDVSNEKSHLLVLPYVGQKVERLIKSIKKSLKYNLPNNIVTKSAYSASKLSNKFKIKSKIKQDHQHDVTYYIKSPEENCAENYIGETGRRLSERVIDIVVSTKLLTY